MLFDQVIGLRVRGRSLSRACSPKLPASRREVKKLVRLIMARESNC